MQPDPRIGIGQCFWHLKMKSDALAAWQRALELVLPLKKPANIVETDQYIRKCPSSNVLSRRSIPRSRHQNLHRALRKRHVLRPKSIQTLPTSPLSSPRSGPILLLQKELYQRHQTL